MTLAGLIVGGLVGTIVMTAMMILGGKMGMMPADWMMIKDGLGGMMNEKMGVPKKAAMVVHLIMGTFVFPLIWMFVWMPIVGGALGSIYISSIVMMLIPGIIMILITPMMEPPEGYRMPMAIGVIIGHIIYPLIMVFTGTLF